LVVRSIAPYNSEEQSGNGINPLAYAWGKDEAIIREADGLVN
jgi:hypothetical protein